MIASLEALRNAGSLAEAQVMFGQYLGLDGPVPAKVIRMHSPISTSGTI